jgi:hypothetical protein
MLRKESNVQLGASVIMKLIKFYIQEMRKVESLPTNSIFKVWNCSKNLGRKSVSTRALQRDFMMEKE